MSPEERYMREQTHDSDDEAKRSQHEGGPPARRLFMWVDPGATDEELEMAAEDALNRLFGPVRGGPCSA